MTSTYVLQTLDELFVTRGLPEYIRSEQRLRSLRRKAVRQWLETLEIKHCYFEAGQPV
jgi:hypothetical protein